MKAEKVVSVVTGMSSSFVYVNFVLLSWFVLSDYCLSKLFVPFFLLFFLLGGGGVKALCK